MIKNCQNSMKSISSGGSYKSILARILTPKEEFKTGFSLMEMMVVLLIISIIMAATAPLVAKKMKVDRAAGGSPWVYTNNDGSIGYNLGGKGISLLIGTSKYNANGGPATPRLVLAGDNNSPAFVFAKKNGDYAGQINMTEDTVTMNGGTGTVGTHSVAIGMGQIHGADAYGTVAIGHDTQVIRPDDIAIGRGAKHVEGTDNLGSAISIGNTATSKNGYSIAMGASSVAAASDSIAIGTNASTEGKDRTRHNEKIPHLGSIAIGKYARAGSQTAVAIGMGAKAFGIASTAIGYNARANSNSSGDDILNTNDYSIAIGNGAQANANNCVAIGSSAVNNTANSILLGTAGSTVYIPGNLVVMGSVLLGGNGSSRVYINVSDGQDNSAGIVRIASDGGILKPTGGNNGYSEGSITGDGIGIGNKELKDANGTVFYTSDKRLKNIGEKYVSGLDAIKKLDIYNFTFKNDKTKTPQVGVIAQDLEKVFPNAVTKDVYGYLRIRWDEMFYAVINAVKELDTRITELSENVKSYFDETKALKATVAEQQKTIDDLVQRIEMLEKKEK